MARAAWAIAKPEGRDYATAVTELNSARLVGEGGIFDRGPHVPITHMGYFKPPQDAFLNELRSRDRRSGKELDHLNAAGVRTELGLAALDVAKTYGGTIEEMTRRIMLAEDPMKAALEFYLCGRNTFGILRSKQLGSRDKCRSFSSNGMTLYSQNPTVRPELHLPVR